MEENGKVSIAHIEAENFLMISKLDYTPRPGMNVFVGGNAQGKTDILKLFHAAMKGLDAKMIKRGTTGAKLMVKLSDGHTIRRSTTQKSKSFTIKNAEGDIKGSPQDFLDRQLGTDLRINPVEWVLLPPKDKVRVIKETFGIGKVTSDMLTGIVSPEDLAQVNLDDDGLSVLRALEKTHYDRRTEVNRQTTQKKALWEERLKEVTGFDPEFYTDRTSEIRTRVDEVRQELSDARAIKLQAERAGESALTLGGRIKSNEDALATLRALNLEERMSATLRSAEDTKKEILELEAALTSARNRLAEKNAEFEYMNDQLDTMTRLDLQLSDDRTSLAALPKTEDVPDIAAIEHTLLALNEDLAGAEQENRSNEQYLVAQEAKKEYETLKTRSDSLTATIDTLRDTLPKQLTKMAELPFESLSFEGDDIYIDGFRLDDMSTKEQLMAVLKVFHEKNKNAKLKVILCDKLEVLDDESYREFWEFANTNGYQVFATKVESAAMPADAVHVEGGELKGVA